MHEYIPEELDIFSERPIIMSVNDSEIIEYSALNSVENSTLLEFHSNSYGDRYKDLSNMYLKLKLKIVKHDGSDYVATDVEQGHLISNALHSIFRTAYTSLNGTNVHSVESNYHYKEFIETTMNYSVESAASRLSTQLFIPDPTPAKLSEISKNSAIFELYGRINLMNLDKLLIPNVDFNLRMSLENSDFFIKEKNEKKSILKFLDAKLFIRHVIPNTEILLAQEKMLGSGRPAVYQYKRGVVLTQNLAKGVTNLNIQNFYNGGIKPCMILFSMVENASYVGTRTSSPHEFKHFGLNTFSFTINGMNRPSNPYEMKDNCYSHVFSRLYETLGYQNSDKSSMVNLKNFSTNRFFMAHDLTNNNMALSDVEDPYSNCNIGVTGTFSTPLQTPISCILYLLLPSRFEISANREVKVII